MGKSKIRISFPPNSNNWLIFSVLKESYQALITCPCSLGLWGKFSISFSKLPFNYIPPRTYNLEEFKNIIYNSSVPWDLKIKTN